MSSPSSKSPVTECVADAKEILARVRERGPLVHNVTNYVAMDFSANALLAIGASPAMIHAAPEVEAFAALSSAVVLNIGTLSPDWVEAMLAAQAATSAPVVVDPVGAGATAYRTEVAKKLVEKRPALVRGNASEILALASTASASSETRGVDATDAVEAAEATAIAVARSTGGVVAITGEVDFITDGTRHFRLRGGDALMTQVTAVGCSLSAVCGAFLAVADGASLTATVAALAVFKWAGENAAALSSGPGSFRVHFLDALAAISADDLDTMGLSVVGPKS